MSNLLTDFRSLCTSNITLPDSGDIIVEHLNVNFQNNLLFLDHLNNIFQKLDLSKSNYQS